MKLLIYKSAVRTEARIPRGQPHGGEWTRNGPPIPSTQAERDTAKQRGTVVPPTSWNVQINPDPKAKVQVTWNDAKGRKQYGYHPDAIAERNAHKFESIAGFAEALPAVREKVETDLQLSDAVKARVLAAVTRLIDTTTMRVGGEKYAAENETYGASSLLKSHVSVDGDMVHLHFSGKHGQEWKRSVSDPALAVVVKHLLTLPGEKLFQYHAGESVKPVTEQTVRDYLKPFGVIPKQFRTFHATRLTTEKLAALGRPTSLKKADAAIVQVIREVAEELGNTPAVCRSSYINPAVLNAYRENLLDAQLGFEMSKAIPLYPMFEGVLKRVGRLLQRGRIADEPEPARGTVPAKRR